MSSASLRVAVAQSDSRLGDLEHNLARASERVAAARADGADVVVFPELHLSGYSIAGVDDDIAIDAHDPRLGAVAAEAGEGAVVLGFLESGRGDHTYNAAAYFQAGELVHVHRKLYLPTYGVFEERKHFSPGTALRAFPTSFGRAAMLVCNDAWQPVLPFLAVQDGAQVLLVPSASSMQTPLIDNQACWSELTRFHARYLQSYVVFVNRVGEEGPLRFWGGSHVVDPWGEVIAAAPEHREATLCVDLDIANVRRRRRELPLVREARLALVGREVERLISEGGDL
jgi:predicted amidohydrolase